MHDSVPSTNILGAIQAAAIEGDKTALRNLSLKLTEENVLDEVILEATKSKPPTQKQVAFAFRLAAEAGETLPSEAYKSATTISDYINAKKQAKVGGLDPDLAQSPSPFDLIRSSDDERRLAPGEDDIEAAAAAQMRISSKADYLMRVL